MDIKLNIDNKKEVQINAFDKENKVFAMLGCCHKFIECQKPFFDFHLYVQQKEHIVYITDLQASFTELDDDNDDHLITA